MSESPKRQFRCAVCRAEYNPPIPAACTRCGGPLLRLVDGWDGHDVDHGPRQVRVMNLAEMAKGSRRDRLAGNKMEEIVGRKDLPHQMIIGSTGLPGCGKSTHALMVAEDRSWSRPLLVSAEEGFGPSVVERMQRVEARSVRVTDSRSIPEIVSAIDEHDADLVIIDSVTYLRLSVQEIKSMARTYEDTSFWCVVQSTKDGGHKGSQEWPHNCDLWLAYDRDGGWVVEKSWYGETGRSGSVFTRLEFEDA